MKFPDKASDVTTLSFIKIKSAIIGIRRRCVCAIDVGSQVLLVLVAGRARPFISRDASGITMAPRILRRIQSVNERERLANLNYQMVVYTYDVIFI